MRFHRGPLRFETTLVLFTHITTKLRRGHGPAGRSLRTAHRGRRLDGSTDDGRLDGATDGSTDGGEGTRFARAVRIDRGKRAVSSTRAGTVAKKLGGVSASADGDLSIQRALIDDGRRDDDDDDDDDDGTAL